MAFLRLSAEPEFTAPVRMMFPSIYGLAMQKKFVFGGASSDDSMLNGKVRDLAIRDAVDHCVDGINNGAWRPAK